MGSRVKDADRKHKKHQHLKPDDEGVLDKFLPIQMNQVRDGWVFKEGWSIRRVATALGTPFTPHNVASFVKKNFAAPTPLDPPSVTVTEKLPVPDAVGCFWDRLDAIQNDIAAVAKDLADHRANVAAMLDEQNKLLGVIRNGVLAIHNEWTGKK